MSQRLRLAGTQQIYIYDTDISLKAWNLNYFNLSLFYEYNHEREYDMQHYNLLTANQTADKRNRYDNRPKSKYIYRIMIDWPFISNKKQQLFFTYGYTQEFHSSERMLYRLDRLGNEWMPDKAPIGPLPSATDLYRHCMDSLNSYHRSYFYRFHSPQLRWFYETEDLQIDAELPLNITYERLNEWRPKGEQSNIRREVFTWPNITVTFKGVELHFDMQHRSPSQTLMLDVRDDSNPLAVYLGNPSLKSSYEYYLDTKWKGFKQEKMRLWNLGFYLYTINNAIGQLRRFNPQTGGYTYTPWNIDGNRGMRFAGNFSQYIDQYRHWFLKIDTDIRLDRSVDFANAGTTDDFQKSIVQNLHVSPNIGIDYRSLKWHAGFKASADWERLTSAQEGFETLSQVDYLYTLNLDTQLPFNVTFNTDMNLFMRRGYGDQSMNTNEWVWNANLSRCIDKRKNWVVKLSAYDLLGQISAVRKTINTQGRVETISNTITQNIMLHLIWKFNKQPSRK